MIFQQVSRWEPRLVKVYVTSPDHHSGKYKKKKEIIIINKIKSCKLVFCWVFNELWKPLPTGWNLADYYLCDLLVKSFRGHGGGRCHANMFGRWGQRLLSGISSLRRAGETGRLGKIVLCLKGWLLHLHSRRERGEGGCLPPTSKLPAVECIFKRWCKRN